MKVAVIDSAPLFRRTPDDEFAEALIGRLRSEGHAVEHVRLPRPAIEPEQPESMELLADAMLAASLTRVMGVDRLVTLRFPSCFVPHPHRVVWWSEGQVPVMVEAITQCLESSVSVYTSTGDDADDLFTRHGAAAVVLHRPLLNEEQFRNEPAEHYILAGGPLVGTSRQMLAIRAMAHTRSGVRLVVAGAADDPAMLEMLHAERASSCAADRITIVANPPEEPTDVVGVEVVGVEVEGTSPVAESPRSMPELVNRALACVSCPIDESVLDGVLLGAALASKPLITTSDSFGSLLLAVDDITGLVCDPDPVSLARVFDSLSRSPKSCDRYGAAARNRVDGLGATWRNVVDRLLA